MRAWSLEQGSWRVREADAPPPPSAGETLVRVSRVGLFFGVGGASIAWTGRVEAVGDGTSATDRARLDGKRVVAGSVSWCARCDMCTRGLRDHCRERRVRDRSALAEWMRVPTSLCCALPDRVDDDAGVFAAPLALARRAASLAAVSGDRWVTVLGEGVVAVLTAQLLRAQGARVRVLADTPTALLPLERLGLPHRGTREAGRRRDQDAVVVCADETADPSLAWAHVRPRGRVVLAGESRVAPIDPAAILEHEVEVVGARWGAVGEAVASLAAGEVEVHALVTRRARLDPAGAALRRGAGEHDLCTILEA